MSHIFYEGQKTQPKSLVQEPCEQKKPFQCQVVHQNNLTSCPAQCMGSLPTK